MIKQNPMPIYIFFFYDWKQKSEPITLTYLNLRAIFSYGCEAILRKSENPPDLCTVTHTYSNVIK